MTRLMPSLSLALFDDSDRAGDVLTSLNNRYGTYAADVARWCQKGTHSPQDGDLAGAIHRANSLAQQLARLN
jgi:hypothetical protein